jgi:flagellar export protein FliJ
MARDPLKVLLTVRQRSVEQARQALGSCLAEEAAATDRIKSLDETTRRNRAATSAAVDLQLFKDMFAIQRNVLQADRHAATLALTAAEQRSAEARAVMVEARTAAESVQRLLDERAARRDAEISRQEQHALDDMARPRANRNAPVT